MIKLVVELLQQPLQHPEAVFCYEARDLYTRLPVESHRRLPVVMQAQLAGLLLSILLMLSLADNTELKQHLHHEHAEQLLLRLARNQTDHAHPYLMMQVLQEERPDVLVKLTELYRYAE